MVRQRSGPGHRPHGNRQAAHRAQAGEGDQRANEHRQREPDAGDNRRDDQHVVKHG